MEKKCVQTGKKTKEAEREQGYTMTKAIQNVRSTGTGSKNKLKPRIARPPRAGIGFYSPTQLSLGPPPTPCPWAQSQETPWQCQFPAPSPAAPDRTPAPARCLPCQGCRWAPLLALALSAVLRPCGMVPIREGMAGPGVLLMPGSLMPRISWLSLLHNKDIKTFLCMEVSKTLTLKYHVIFPC